MIRLKKSSFLFCLFCVAFPIFSSGESLDEPFDDLVGAVMEADEEDLDPALMFLIDEFSADTLVSAFTTANVLAYLEDIYSEHGYLESGNWAKDISIRRYIPRPGELPVYQPDNFLIPVKGKLTSGYGYRPNRNRYHRGIDMALNIGDTVKSALPGIVTIIAYDKRGYGNYVLVSHGNGVETLYGHLALSLVTPGQKLHAGQPLGIGGNTGNSTGPHLHFETRYRGMALDPVEWFGIKF